MGSVVIGAAMPRAAIVGCCLGWEQIPLHVSCSRRAARTTIRQMSRTTKFCLGSCTDFKCSLPGSAWLMQDHGVAYDAFKAEASRSSAKHCRWHLGLHPRSRYNIQKFGTRVDSGSASAWSPRMQFYFDVFLHCGKCPV